MGGVTLGQLGFCTSWAVDADGDGPEWVEVVEVDLPVCGLGDAFVGMRIVHVSDLHYSRTVSSRYLRDCIDRINQLEADIVVLTGDYITYDFKGSYQRKMAKMLGRIVSEYGVYACLGNHDYGMDGFCGGWQEDKVRGMVFDIEGGGVRVLRNACGRVEVDGDVLWFAGLGDLWAKDFDPDSTFKGVDKSGAVIALSHNPKTVGYLRDYAFDAVLSGHTHGVSFQFSRRFGRVLVGRHLYHSGLYDVGGKKLYVNRGLGRLGRAFFNSRPEITVFKLRLA